MARCKRSINTVMKKLCVIDSRSLTLYSFKYFFLIDLSLRFTAHTSTYNIEVLLWRYVRVIIHTGAIPCCV